MDDLLANCRYEKSMRKNIIEKSSKTLLVALMLLCIYEACASEEMRKTAKDQKRQIVNSNTRSKRKMLNVVLFLSTSSAFLLALVCVHTATRTSIRKANNG